ncbi:MAG: class I SAM-dependent methyltransferase [Deltaproteobacteria bacterium]
MNCRLCSSKNTRVIHPGPIRSGGVGSEFIDGFTVIGCEDCGFAFLNPIPENLDRFYETHEYREKFDYEFSPASIQKKYDHEQNERVQRIGIQNLRSKTVLDLGASAGVFLDAIKGVADQTIAVEPSEIFREYLISKGHIYYPYPEDAIAANECADIVTSFDVIEHLPDPANFVRQAFKLLKRGGTFILSMPNLDDLLLRAHSVAFEPFFFQIAHLNYFGKRAIPVLFEGSGFPLPKIGFLHKYGIENLIRWSKYLSPGTVPEVDGLFDEAFNRHYRVEIERSGIASHLFIVAKKDY